MMRFDGMESEEEVVMMEARVQAASREFEDGGWEYDSDEDDSPP